MLRGSQLYKAYIFLDKTIIVNGEIKGVGMYKGSEWRKWDLHTALTYDSKYQSDDAEVLLYNAFIL